MLVRPLRQMGGLLQGRPLFMASHTPVERRLKRAYKPYRPRFALRCIKAEARPSCATGLDISANRVTAMLCEFTKECAGPAVT